MRCRNYLIGFFLIPIMGSAVAAMRCGTGLVNVGGKIADVLQACGQPVAQDAEGLALRNNGIPQKGSSKQDVLVYGPNGGSYQYLLFVNDELVRIDMRREAPGSDLLHWKQ